MDEVISDVISAVTSAIGKLGSLFASMDPATMAVVAVCALSLGAFWLKGDPVKGA